MTDVSDEGGGGCEMGGGDSSLPPRPAGVFIGCWSAQESARTNELQARSEQAILHFSTSSFVVSLIFEETIFM